MTITTAADAARILNRVLDVCAQDASADLITQGRGALKFLVERLHQVEPPLQDWADADLKDPKGNQTMSTANGWNVDEAIQELGERGALDEQSAQAIVMRQLANLRAEAKELADLQVLEQAVLEWARAILAQRDARLDHRSSREMFECASRLTKAENILFALAMDSELRQALKTETAANDEINPTPAGK